ncbi:MAG: NAD(P)/FAD-dependent oxidoreductase [Myxococcota bacterium]|nr:NAD(P)/FAD-dependent oxidoreductase [Myxococcota bacterium]
MSRRRGFDAVVIGAGAVGLASASALARSGRSVLVLERQGGIAREITARNSQVIHAGLYSPPESLKTTLCVRGRELLYPWLSERGVAFRKLGKLVVATDTPGCARLEALRARGHANGVPGLELLDASETRRREPAVVASGALFSPESGILDVAGFALSLLADAENHGANLLLEHQVVALERVPVGWRVEVCGPGQTLSEGLECEIVVNAAGLGSDRIAEMAGVAVDAQGYRLKPCKGSYFALAPPGGMALDHLVYPLPPGASDSGAGGLGIHATPDLFGGVRLGPDAEYGARLDLAVDPNRADFFAESVRHYLPQVEASWCRADFAGLRPKLAGPGEEFRDFIVQEESARGLPGLINCVGIESPGLTAALAIAERVVAGVRGET